VFLDGYGSSTLSLCYILLTVHALSQESA
jgi:hypothetical protein